MYFPAEPTIYMDVTQMLGNRLHTGIQRVVRELARVGPNIAGQFQRNCRLVHAFGPKFFRLRYEHIDLHQRHFLFRIAERHLGRRLLKRAYPWTSSPIKPHPDDILVTLNATWDHPGWAEAVAEFHRTGFVSNILYDLTPYSHPQFHTPELSQRFATWLSQVKHNSDHWIGISRHVATELEGYLDQVESGSGGSNRPTVSTFRLGSDFQTGVSPLKSKSQMLQIRPTLTAFLANLAGTLLMVGTLEPRKNHTCVFQACRELWKRGWNGQLLIIGRPGWKCDEIVRDAHSMPAGRFLWLSDANDEELQFAYRQSQSLVFPSWEEGFGLPIVEALRQGTPVIASDHPVHREVGRQWCQYFHADSPEQLAAVIIEQGRDRFQALRQRAATFVPVTWAQSCRELLADVILAASKKRQQTKPLPRRLHRESTTEPTLPHNVDSIIVSAPGRSAA
ncbi:MAG: glycosyltransferase family 1 protein [Pirellulaceae bacterium]|nr:glycosyltransferase family 1 protein [Pirellulaceae bacterium]